MANKLQLPPFVRAMCNQVKQAQKKWHFEKTANKVPANFDENSSAVITAVAQGSPAEIIGISKNDRLVSFNGEDFDEQATLDNTAEESVLQCRFYLRSSHSFLDLKIDPLPLGVLAEPPSNKLVANMRSMGFVGWEAFHLLWERREWEKLLIASEKVYSNNGLSKLIRKIWNNFGLNTGMLYTGAALFELNREQEGIDLIVHFMNTEMRGCDTHEHAIAYFYLARWCELLDNTEDMMTWYAEADRNNANRFKRISHAVYSKGLQPYPERYRWKGKAFPMLYNLKSLSDSKEMVSLTKALNSMSADQLLPICVMPGYRNNGPYNEAMGCYRSIYPYLCDRLLPLHIILDTLESAPENEWRQYHENMARETGIPFVLLHDPDSEVSESLELEFSPVFYCLNNEGNIIHDGNMKTGYDYWTVLSQ